MMLHPGKRDEAVPVSGLAECRRQPLTATEGQFMNIKVSLSDELAKFIDAQWTKSRE
jgi:hypothetical protein